MTHTAIILTADHGTQDTPPTPADRYSVPFFVWGPGVAAGADLYALNVGRRQAATTYPMTTYAGTQPIRNAEVNNLALQLLGIRPIPGSMFNYAQDLKVAPALMPLITGITQDGHGTLTVGGAADQIGRVALWKSTGLAGSNWLPIQTNSVLPWSAFSFTVPQGTDSRAFFKMQGL